MLAMEAINSRCNCYYDKVCGLKQYVQLIVLQVSEY